MRTIQGPFCDKCGVEVQQVPITQPTGYVKWTWVHIAEACDALRVAPDWKLVKS